MLSTHFERIYSVQTPNIEFSDLFYRQPLLCRLACFWLDTEDTESCVFDCNLRVSCKKNFSSFTISCMASCSFRNGGALRDERTCSGNQFYTATFKLWVWRHMDIWNIPCTSSKNFKKAFKRDIFQFVCNFPYEVLLKMYASYPFDSDESSVGSDVHQCAAYRGISAINRDPVTLSSHQLIHGDIVRT